MSSKNSDAEAVARLAIDVARSLLRKKPKERPSEPEPRLHQLRLAIATVSDEPNFGKDPTVAAAKAAALLTRALVKETISTIADDDDRFVAGIFAFVFSNYFTIVVGGRFEEASVIALSEVIGTEESDHCLTTIGNSYNQMIHSKPKLAEAIGKACEAWFKIPEAAQFRKLVELFKSFRTHLR